MKSTAAIVAGSALAMPQVASAVVDVPDQITDFKFPEDWGLTFNYDSDAAKVREHMFTATAPAGTFNDQYAMFTGIIFV